jgi:putative heme-binding domain-containing protein
VEDLDRLGELLSAQNSTPVQRAGLAALGRSRQARVPEVLLARWRGYSPTLRAEVVNNLFGRAEWTRAFLTAIEQQRVAPNEIHQAQQEKLLAHADDSIRQRAKKLFAVTSVDRQKVLKDYAVVKGLTGDPAKGAALFQQNCAVCHRLKGEGNGVGPDLGTMSDKTVAALLTAILDPNQAVEAQYLSYTAVTRSEREIGGVIAVETPNSITLRTATGTEEIILRSDLKKLTGSGLSLMPEGFEKTLRPPDLADVIAYITAK